MSGILLATDGGLHCKRAEDYALDHCRRHGTPLDIIHVVEHGLSHYGQVDSLASEGDRSDFIAHVRRQQPAGAGRRLARAANAAVSGNIHYRLYIEWESPLYSILRHIRRNEPELLVMGGGRTRRNPFSLARRLGRKASCAVRQVT
jgi:nucleotide-binding universal stress UspA family protein